MFPYLEWPQRYLAMFQRNLTNRSFFGGVLFLFLLAFADILAFW